jgi:hypothetical protein
MICPHRVPRSELLDPAGIVRFRVRDEKQGGTVVATDAALRRV